MMEKKKHEKYDLERRRPLFFGIGMTVALSLTIVAFEWRSPVDPINIFEQEPEIIDCYLPPITNFSPPPPPKAPVVIETSNEQEVPEEEIEIDVDPSIFDQPEIILIPTEIPDEPVHEATISVAEVMPSYKGGLSEFYKYLAKNTHYPAQAKRIGIEGRVYVQFIVEKDGSLSDIKVLKGIGAGCDEEAIKVMQNAPDFLPGKQGDVHVRVKMVVPINFTLQ